MDKYFKAIASIQLFHDFYAGKALNAAMVTPLPETAVFFKNHRMMFKKKGNEHVILQEASTQDQEATISFEPRDLLFGISFNDTQYQLRSGLNYDPRRQKIVIESAEENDILVSEKNIIPVVNAPVASENEVLVVTDQREQVVFSSDKDLPVQFVRLDAGVYKANGIPFLKCDQCSEFEAVLILKLTPAENTKKITLPAGRYHWRYQVQKKYSQPEILSLIDENEKVRFDSAASAKEDILIFLSGEPVTLSDQVFTSLALYNNDIIVKKFLPVPGLDNVRFLSAEDRTLVLEAYVTV